MNITTAVLIGLILIAVGVLVYLARRVYGDFSVAARDFTVLLKAADNDDELEETGDA